MNFKQSVIAFTAVFAFLCTSLFGGDPNDDLEWDRMELDPAVTEYEVAVVTPGQNMNSGGVAIQVSVVAQPVSGNPKIKQAVLFAGLADGNKTVQMRGKVTTGHFTQWSTPLTVTFTNTIAAAPQNVHEVVN